MFRTAIAASALLLVATPASAETLTPTQIVERHTASGGNLDQLMSDYAEDAVVLQEGRAIQGKPAIRELFARMFAPRPPAPAGSEGAGADRGGGGGGGMNVTRVWEEGDVGFMTWEAGPMHVTEEFLVRDGKILVQTIFRSSAPAPAAAR